MLDDIYKSIVQETDEAQSHRMVDAADLDPVRKQIYHAYILALASKVNEAGDTLFSLDAEDAWNADDPLLIETRMLIEWRENRLRSSYILATRAVALEPDGLTTQFWLAVELGRKRKFTDQYACTKAILNRYPDSLEARYMHLQSLLSYRKDENEARKIVDSIPVSLRQIAYKFLILFGPGTLINLTFIAIFCILCFIPDLRWILFSGAMVISLMMDWVVAKRLKKDQMLISLLFTYKWQLFIALAISVVIPAIFSS